MNMNSKPLYADQKHYWRRGFARGFACGIILVLVLILAMVFVEHALGQNTDESLGEELKTILHNQQLPSEVEKLPYLSYASLEGALWAYREMPKPTYIIPKRMLFSITGKDSDGKWVTLYRVYFTPKPGTTYNVPQGKVVRYNGG